MLIAGYKIKFIHSECFACDYVERLLKYYRMYDDVEKIHVDSDEGQKIRNQYNFKKIPVLMIYFDEHLITIISDISKEDVIKLRDECCI